MIKTVLNKNESYVKIIELDCFINVPSIIKKRLIKTGMEVEFVD